MMQVPDRVGEGRLGAFRRWLASRRIADESLPVEVRAVLFARGRARPSAKEERRVLDGYRAQVESQQPRPTGGHTRAVALLEDALARDSLGEARVCITSALAVLGRTVEQHAHVAARKRQEARSRTTALALREEANGGGASAVQRRRDRPESGLGVLDPLRALPPASPPFIAQLVERARELGTAAPSPRPPIVDHTLLLAISTAKEFAQKLVRERAPLFSV